MKNQQGGAWHVGNSDPIWIENAILNDLYLNTTTCDIFKLTGIDGDVQSWTYLCSTKGESGRNGVDGVNGKNSYIHIRYASQRPTDTTILKTIADAWIGIYCGPSQTAPTDFSAYTWYELSAANETNARRDYALMGISIIIIILLIILIIVVANKQSKNKGNTGENDKTQNSYSKTTKDEFSNKRSTIRIVAAPPSKKDDPYCNTNYNKKLIDPNDINDSKY